MPAIQDDFNLIPSRPNLPIKSIPVPSLRPPHINLKPDPAAPSPSSTSNLASWLTPANKISPSSSSRLSHLPSRPPNRFRRATDSSIKPFDFSKSDPTSHHSFRRHQAVYSRLTRPLAFVGSRIISFIASALWVSEPTGSRRAADGSQSTWMRRLPGAALLRSLGLSTPASLALLLLVLLGIFELWQSNQGGLDSQDWGPTRFRAGRRTGAETRRLRKQMREAPFQTLAELGALPDHLLPASEPPGLLAQRWLRPLTPHASVSGRGDIPADVTAVVLNWHRPENVIVIVAHLCRYDFFKSIIVWNNDPDQRLTREDFQHTDCPSHKLSIYNAPSNTFFIARFLACLQATTKYCYFQDDDCIVKSIRTMYYQFKSLQPDPGAVVVQADPVYSVMYGWEWCFNDRPGRLHTCFAWLGHGAFVSKTSVDEFLSMISEQGLPSDAIALADNFFTTALNREPNVVVSSKIVGLPLSEDGFSDGTAGLERNRLYIQRGVERLSRLLDSGRGLRVSGNVRGTGGGTVRAAEGGDRAFLVTNVEAFPGGRPAFERFEDGLAGWEDHLGTTGHGLGRAAGRVGVRKARAEWAEREREATWSGYAAAMDGNNETAWRSADSIKKDDWVGLGWIDKAVGPVEVHLLVSEPDQLQADGVTERQVEKDVWEPVGADTEWRCEPAGEGRMDCMARLAKGALGVRTRKMVDGSGRWCLWEAFVRGL